MERSKQRAKNFSDKELEALVSQLESKPHLNRYIVGPDSIYKCTADIAAAWEEVAVHVSARGNRGIRRTGKAVREKWSKLKSWTKTKAHLNGENTVTSLEKRILGLLAESSGVFGITGGIDSSAPEEIVPDNHLPFQDQLPKEQNNLNENESQDDQNFEKLEPIDVDPDDIITSPSPLSPEDTSNPFNPEVWCSTSHPPNNTQGSVRRRSSARGKRKIVYERPSLEPGSASSKVAQDIVEHHHRQEAILLEIKDSLKRQANATEALLKNQNEFQTKLLELFEQHNSIMQVQLGIQAKVHKLLPNS